jgi:hypothetical protein
LVTHTFQLTQICVLFMFYSFLGHTFRFLEQLSGKKQLLCCDSTIECITTDDEHFSVIAPAVSVGVSSTAPSAGNSYSSFNDIIEPERGSCEDDSWLHRSWRRASTTLDALKPSKASLTSDGLRIPEYSHAQVEDGLEGAPDADDAMSVVSAESAPRSHQNNSGPVAQSQSQSGAKVNLEATVAESQSEFSVTALEKVKSAIAKDMQQQALEAKLKAAVAQKPPPVAAVSTNVRLTKEKRAMTAVPKPDAKLGGHCSTCASALVPGAPFCAQCGTAAVAVTSSGIPISSHCKGCGKTALRGGKFCFDCAQHVVISPQGQFLGNTATNSGLKRSSLLSSHLRTTSQPLVLSPQKQQRARSLSSTPVKEFTPRATSQPGMSNSSVAMPGRSDLEARLHALRTKVDNKHTSLPFPHIESMGIEMIVTLMCSISVYQSAVPPAVAAPTKSCVSCGGRLPARVLKFCLHCGKPL